MSREGSNVGHAGRGQGGDREGTGRGQGGGAGKGQVGYRMAAGWTLNLARYSKMGGKDVRAYIYTHSLSPTDPLTRACQSVSNITDCKYIMTRMTLLITQKIKDER